MGHTHRYQFCLKKKKKKSPSPESRVPETGSDPPIGSDWDSGRDIHSVVASYGFVENKVDQCIYCKVNGRKFIFLILYVDDILLSSSDLGLLHETKRMLSKNFDMKDLGEASFVLGIEIHRNRSRGLLGLSQRAYVDRILERFNMQQCKPGIAPVCKGDKLSLSQCPHSDFEKAQMKNVPYASALGSIMYAQVCTKPDIAFAT